MTTYYAVGATYDGVTNSLATSTGGSATVAVVTSADTIILDGSSIAIAFTVDPACALINIEAAFAHTATLSHAISAGEIEMAATAGTLTTDCESRDLRVTLTIEYLSLSAVQSNCHLRKSSISYLSLSAVQSNCDVHK